MLELLRLLLSHFSCVRLCATPWTAAHQAPPSLGFSRQEHWSGLLFPSPMQGTANNSPQAKSGMTTHLHIVCSLFCIIIVELGSFHHDLWLAKPKY